MIPTSIDGTDITGATIDGTDVQEITVDGDVVFSAVQGLNNYIFDDFNDNDLTRPRTGQQDYSYTAQDGTVYNDARIRPDWTNFNNDFFVSNGELVIDENGTPNAEEDGIVTPSSIQPPCTITFDWNLPLDNTQADLIRVGLSDRASGNVFPHNNNLAIELRSTTDPSVIRFDGGAAFGPDLTTNSGLVEFIIEDGFQEYSIDGVVQHTASFSINFNFTHLFIMKFDDGTFNHTHFVDNLALF